MNPDNNNTSTLDLRRHWRAMRRGWPLYLLALVVMLGLATYYACNKQDQYRISGMVLIEDEKESPAGLKAMGGMTQMMRSFSLGGFSSDAANECDVLNSNDVRLRAIKALGLNRVYVKKTGWRTKKLLYRDSPIRIEAPDSVFDIMTKTFTVNVTLHDGKADISVKPHKWFAPTFWSAKGVTLPCTISTPYGPMQMLKTAHYKPAERINMFVNVLSNQAMAQELHRITDIRIPDKKSDAIRLMIKDNRERGMDIINALIAAYNEKRIGRRNERAQAEVDFVNNRIAALQGDLSVAEGKVAQFKQKHNINNPALEAQGWFKVSTEAQAQVSEAQAEITTYEMLLATLNGTQHDAMLPTVATDPSIAEYNELMARRRALAQSAAPGNAALEALDQQIKPLRKSIVQRAQKNAEAARIRLRAIYAQAGKAQGKFSSLPGIENDYYDLLRDRELKNDLYVFLLEKKESALLKLNANSSPAFVLDQAYSQMKPDSTKAIIVYVIALLLALLGPTALLLWRMRRRDLIEAPCDLTTPLEGRTIEITTADATTLAASLITLPAETTVHVVKGDNDSQLVTQVAAAVGVQGVHAKVQDTAHFKEYAEAIHDTPSQQRWLVLPDVEHAAACLQLTPESSPVLVLLRPGQVKRKTLFAALTQVAPSRCIIAIVHDQSAR